MQTYKQSFAPFCSIPGNLFDYPWWLADSHFASLYFLLLLTPDP